MTDEKQKPDLGFQNYASVCMQMKNQWRRAPSEGQKQNGSEVKNSKG